MRLTEEEREVVHEAGGAVDRELDGDEILLAAVERIVADHEREAWRAGAEWARDRHAEFCEDGDIAAANPHRERE